MVNVTHDRHDRRTRLELFRRVFDDCFIQTSGVFLFLDRLETKFAGDELDLIEVESLVDGDHQSKVLECKCNDLRRADLEDLRELTDRNELVDANGFLFALCCCGALCLDLFAALIISAASASAAHDSLTQRAHRARNAGCYCFLIDGTTLSLAVAAAAIITTTTTTSTAATTALTTIITAGSGETSGRSRRR